MSRVTVEVQTYSVTHSLLEAVAAAKFLCSHLVPAPEEVDQVAAGWPEYIFISWVFICTCIRTLLTVSFYHHFMSSLASYHQ